MPVTPIAHFSGKFRFHMPEYNNDPNHEKVPFDPNRTAQEVEAVCGCDPAHYFEFTFFNTRILQVTYRDGNKRTTGDTLLGQSVELAGLMPDVAASAICAQIFAGRFSIGTEFKGRMRKAVQSDLRLSIRTGFADETASAFFTSVVDAEAIGPGEGSRSLREWVGTKAFEIHFHLNHYTRLDNKDEPATARLTGDVYGYIRPLGAVAEETSSGTRWIRRKLVAHPELRSHPEIERFYLTLEGQPVVRITDIDGSYDVSLDERLLTMRYVDYVPFLDRAYTSPAVAGYVVSTVLADGMLGSEIGRFVGDHGEMLRSGGLLCFSIPAAIADLASLRLAVHVVDLAGTRVPLMLETEWDLVLESDRGVTLASGSGLSLEARVFRNNRPWAGHEVRLRAETQNGRSPVVAGFAESLATTDASGRIRAGLQAKDLNALAGAFDPVTQATIDRLPQDRYAGSYVYMEIDNPLRRTNPPKETVQIAVRVLHKIDETNLPKAPSFEADIKPLFAYYVRYFPFLHVRRQGDTFVQFFTVDDASSLANYADEILHRLQLSDDDPKRMPRSRDFPIGGVTLFQRWVDAGFPA